MLPFFRIVRFALQDMFRNFSLSFMTVLVLILLLLSVNTLIAVRVLTGEAITTVKQQIDVSVYFNPKATDTQVGEVRSFVEAFPEVTKTTFLNKDESLGKFRELYQANPAILASLDELGDNPLGATLIVKTKEPQDYEKIMNALALPEYAKIIDAKTFGDTQTAITKIQQITTQVERFTLGLTVLFAVISFIIIFNTVRVAIYTQRTEISIKKLVGATNWYVRGPYVVESILFSLVALGVAYGLVRLVLVYAEPYLTTVFNRAGILTNYLGAHIIELAAWQLGAVVILTVGTSLLAMRRYLKV
jgi:cell division transport system permease protein